MTPVLSDLLHMIFKQSAVRYKSNLKMWYFFNGLLDIYTVLRSVKPW